MDADLDTLCTAVYVTADDLLPRRAANARRELDDAEVVTLAVAQVVMGIPSDRRFLAVARRRLGHLFPRLPRQPAYLKRRNRLRETIDWLAGVFASQSPGHHDDVVLLDSTPVECGRSVDTARRSALADWAGYGWSRSHSRFFWGMRLHLCCAPDGTPRRAELVGADRKEREVALDLLPHVLRGGELVVSRQGLCRARLRAGGGGAGRGGRAPRPQGRAGGEPAASGPNPPTDRVGLPDLQGPLVPGAPRRAHPGGAACPHRGAHPGPGRLCLAQPPPRATEPLARGLRGLSAWNQSSSRTRGTRTRRLAPADAVRGVPPAEAILVYGHLPPARLCLRPWYRERGLRRLAAGEEAT
jgi:hypothetical protein